MAQLSAMPNVETLHAQLRARMVELRPLVVVDVMQLFLEVSSSPCKEKLASLEFAFDEDEGRLARIEARFVRRGSRDGLDGDPIGYQVELLLPRLIPVRSPADGEASTHVLATAAREGSLVARFVRALADLGAYRAIEALVVLEADVHLL